jgi:hypothetical protein
MKNPKPGKEKDVYKRVLWVGETIPIRQETKIQTRREDLILDSLFEKIFNE